MTEEVCWLQEATAGKGVGSLAFSRRTQDSEEEVP